MLERNGQDGSLSKAAAQGEALLRHFTCVPRMKLKEGAKGCIVWGGRCLDTEPNVRGHRRHGEEE